MALSFTNTNPGAGSKTGFDWEKRREEEAARRKRIADEQNQRASQKKESGALPSYDDLMHPKVTVGGATMRRADWEKSVHRNVNRRYEKRKLDAEAARRHGQAAATPAAPGSDPLDVDPSGRPIGGARRTGAPPALPLSPPNWDTIPRDPETGKPMDTSPGRGAGWKPDPNAPMMPDTRLGTNVVQRGTPRGQPGRALVKPPSRPELSDTTLIMQNGQPTEVPAGGQAPQSTGQQFGDQMIMRNGRAIHIPAPGTTTRFKRGGMNQQQPSSQQQWVAQRAADKRALMGGGFGVGRTVSSGAMIKGEKDTAAQNQYFEGASRAGGPAFERLREQMMNTPEQRKKQQQQQQAVDQERQNAVQTLTGRFMHSVQNFRPEKAVEYLEAWFDNGLTEDDMTPEMHQLYLDWADDGKINAMLDAEAQQTQEGLQAQQDRAWTQESRDMQRQRFAQGQADEQMGAYTEAIDNAFASFKQMDSIGDPVGAMNAVQTAVETARQAGQPIPEWAQAELRAQSQAEAGYMTPTARGERMEAAQEAQQKKRAAMFENVNKTLEKAKTPQDFGKMLDRAKQRYDMTDEEVESLPAVQQMQLYAAAGLPYPPPEATKGLSLEKKTQFMGEAMDIIAGKGPVVDTKDKQGTVTGTASMTKPAIQFSRAAEYEGFSHDAALKRMYAGDGKEFIGLKQAWKNFSGSMKNRASDAEAAEMWVAALHQLGPDAVDAFERGMPLPGKRSLAFSNIMDWYKQAPTRVADEMKGQTKLIDPKWKAMDEKSLVGYIMKNPRDAEALKEAKRREAAKKASGRKPIAMMF